MTRGRRERLRMSSASFMWAKQCDGVRGRTEPGEQLLPVASVPTPRTRTRTEARLDMTLRRTLALIAALFSLAAFAGQAQASKTQESIVQDDRMLLNYGSGVQTGALNDLDSLGVTTVHVDITWKSLAPSPDSSKPPQGKDLTNPQMYKAGRWAALDLLVRSAQLRGMQVLLTPTSPAPLWGTSCSRAERKRARIKGICKPKASLYGKFVTALGKRYSGTYTDPRDETRLPLPRLDRWSLYNEPNLKSWLYPATTRSRGKNVPVDAKAYR